MRLFLGHDLKTGRSLAIPQSSFSTHWHLIGGTGKGKTTAIHTLLQPLLLDPVDQACHIIVDRLGNFSSELLLWMASDFCTEDVRQRLVYIEPAREDRVIGFNPLLYDTPAHGHYKVSRATDVILRAWESVNIEAMPRLARWTFNAFWSAAQLGLTIADCAHFLMPGSPYHAALLACLPEQLRYEWREILDARGEATRILDSSRNRLKPYFDSDILRRMFGTTQHRLDVLRFMREARIVVLNLAPRDRLSTQLSDCIGALVLNEVLATARSLPRGVRYPTYVWLDEFQNFVGPDIESALPEVRQLGIRLILSHQSFSQLERGPYDLTAMIWQAQSRMIFGLQGDDADLVAQELASLTYDPKRIKDELYTRRQLTTGHRIVELASWSKSKALAEQWQETYGRKSDRRETVSRHAAGEPQEIKARGTSAGDTFGRGRGGGTTETDSQGGHQTLVPELDEFLELSTRSFYTFEEQKNLWAQDVRRLRTGEAVVRLVNDPLLHHVRIKRSAAGYLGWDAETLARELPEVHADVDRLVEENFRSDLFLSPAAIDVETQARLAAILRPPIRIQAPSSARESVAEPPDDPSPFA